MENLPANPLSDFVKGADANRRPVAPPAGDFLKFNGKTGDWSLGQEETPVNGELAVIMSPSMMHGYVRWGEVPPAKAYTSIAHPLPEKPEPIDGTDMNNKPCTFYARDSRQVAGKFLEDDLGQFMFNTDSMGGVERMDELFDKIIAKARESAFCFPQVKLASDWYKRTTGKVFKPVFEIAVWCDQDGNPETGKLDAPTRRRRRVAN